MGVTSSVVPRPTTHTVKFDSPRLSISARVFEIEDGHADRLLEVQHLVALSCTGDRVAGGPGARSTVSAGTAFIDAGTGSPMTVAGASGPRSC